MGKTPSKDSSVGKKVVEYMESLGDYVRRDNDGNPKWIKSLTDDKWYKFSDMDMSHKNASFENLLYEKANIVEVGHKDAVEKWNTELKYTGARSTEVKNYMNDPDNYYLEYKSYNRSEGAKLGMTYDQPEKTNKCNR